MYFKIGGIQKSSLLDYPEKISAIVFTQGCNYRCGYCHNPELIGANIEKEMPIQNVSAFFEFLKTRINKLDGVVITGGEPTLQPDLKEFIKQIKTLGFLVKLDTNGTNPEVLKELIDENLLDYIAMDIKAPIDKYSNIVNVKINTDNIKKSIELIMNSNVDYEFRTTVIQNQLSFNDFEKIGQMIKGAKKYYLQKFISSKILDENLANEKTYSQKDFEKIITILKKYINFVEVR